MSWIGGSIFGHLEASPGACDYNEETEIRKNTLRDYSICVLEPYSFPLMTLFINGQVFSIYVKSIFVYSHLNLGSRSETTTVSFVISESEGAQLDSCNRVSSTHQSNLQWPRSFISPIRCLADEKPVSHNQNRPASKLVPPRFVLQIDCCRMFRLKLRSRNCY